MNSMHVNLNKLVEILLRAATCRLQKNQGKISALCLT